ncbi:signal recognition particle protein [Pirellula staleyi DSM 6068]|uniref:Signal recognition particle protein n=1 Tax=Pirellula staleyi (strain ATCC 27377 / DSM 6068 / ICPB 4128) TaxID=530564 RepID=D2R2U0_PIRSD|nr:signal recognition particle protein [Pirellula staleyi]ADB16930.1 signal recognition particle protein [Pirellula staleyi DSM 6068]
MFESLQNGLKSALKTLQGKARLTESNMREGLKLVEQSLLEADVGLDVVRDFMGRVTEKAVGEKVLLALDPTQQVVGIVRDELITLLGGPAEPTIKLKAGLNIFMLCGLQGSGKTTTCGKLSTLLMKSKQSVMLCAADLQRPAAIEQLHIIGKQLGVPVFSKPGEQDPVKVCQEAVEEAKKKDVTVLILDTAGRLAIDEELMAQLKRIDNRVEPDQVFLVVDGMTGQDAVRSAGAFNDALELDGLIMTKLDGDTRGGALLSVRQVTGVPIKFIGTGEHLDALEPFRPEGMAGRILGLGDVLGLVDVVRSAVDEQQAKELEAKLAAGDFTLDDFKKQLKSVLQPGLMMKMLGMLPGMGDLTKMMSGMDAEGGARRLVGIIDSMTPQERRIPKIIDMQRRQRIARGAGVQPQEVNELLKQYNTMAPIMKMMAGQGAGGRMAAIQQLQRSGAFNPGAQLSRPKGDTGKRLSSEEKADLRKKREKELRKKRRGGRD